MSFGNNSFSGEIDGSPFHMSSFGSGPFMFRIDGKRVFFEDSDMFGPSVLRKSDWNPSACQPGERSRFWDAYCMWRKVGRPLRGTRRVKIAVWSEPKKGQYWRDARGVSHILSDPDLDHLGYECVEKPAPVRSQRNDT